MTASLECADTGLRTPLAVGDWSRPATAAELEVLEAVEPTVLDVGCGPGRIAHALGARGVPSLGIDVAPSALRCASQAGVAVLERSVFDPLPGEGRWGTALLLDGNIGIGGDPVALLARVSELVLDGGRLLVELGAPGARTATTTVRVVVECQPPGPWFSWATVSVDDVEPIACCAGLQVDAVRVADSRYFAWLR